MRVVPPNIGLGRTAARRVLPIPVSEHGGSLHFALVLSTLWRQAAAAMPSSKPEPALPARPRMLSEVVRAKLRAGHYSLRTEEAYLGWVRRFIVFHGRRHPRELGAAEVAGFLEHLAGKGAVNGIVSFDASTHSTVRHHFGGIQALPGAREPGLVQSGSGTGGRLPVFERWRRAPWTWRGPGASAQN